MGKLGVKVAKYILERKNLEITDVIDKDREKVGKNLSDILSDDTNSSIKILENVDDALKNCKADICNTFHSFEH